MLSTSWPSQYHSTTCFLSTAQQKFMGENKVLYRFHSLRFFCSEHHIWMHGKVMCVTKWSSPKIDLPYMYIYDRLTSNITSMGFTFNHPTEQPSDSYSCYRCDGVLLFCHNTGQLVRNPQHQCVLTYWSTSCRCSTH